jgi:methylated-DNA-[protein]-cysteine S-methyltransferase
MTSAGALPIPEVAVATVPGPWGPIHLAARQGRLVALEVLTPTDAFVAGLARRLAGPVVPAAEAGRLDRATLARATDEVHAYLDGEAVDFDIPLDLAGLAAWDRAVLAGVRAIPYGAVTSYGRLARLIGRPGAARAVGGAVGRNPVGILVPCHRVIAGDGSLGGYGGDWYGTREQLLAVKRWLLEREGTSLPAARFFEGAAV